MKTLVGQGSRMEARRFVERREADPVIVEARERWTIGLYLREVKGWPVQRRELPQAA